MANDCLQQKLKGTVQNDNLPLIDTVMLNVKSLTSYESNDYTFRGAGFSRVKVVGDGSFSVNGEGSYTDYQNQDLGFKIYTCVPGNYKILIYNKYGIQQLIIGASVAGGGISVEASQMDYVKPTYLQLEGESLVGEYKPMQLERIDTMFLGDSNSIKDNLILDIANLKNAPALKYVSISYNSNVNGDISALTSIPLLEEFGASNTSISGNIESLSGCTKLNMFGAGYVTAITGEIRTLAASMAPNRGSSERLMLIVKNTNVTDDGNVVTEEYLASKGATNGRIWINFDGSGGYTISYQ